MKLGILHLSDLHIGTVTPEINTLNSLVCSLKYKIQDVTELLIIISGDIAQSGKKEEYELAFDYFMHLEAGFLKQREDLNIRFIVSPGNHDFENRPHDIRDSIISNELKNGFPTKDSFIETCTSLQNNFFEFQKRIMKLDEVDLLKTSKEIKFETFDLWVDCINTAWMSLKHEKAGTLVFPKINQVDNKLTNRPLLKIAVFHHPLTWFNAQIPNNSTRDIKLNLLTNYSLVFTGHEHQAEMEETKILDSVEKSFIISGAEFDVSKNSLGFNFIEIDESIQELSIKCFEKTKTYFNEARNAKEQLHLGFFKQKFRLKNDFRKLLVDSGVYLTSTFKENISLDDIYIYPRLEKITGTTFDEIKIIKSENIFKEDEKNIILLGEEQSGKSSLLKVMFNNAFVEGLVPVLLDGQDITNENCEQILKNAVFKTYENTDKEFFQYYVELDKKLKIILIDNLDKSTLKEEALLRVLNNIEKDCYKLVFTMNEVRDFEFFYKDGLLKDFNRFKILPFGHELREDLIRKWKTLGANASNSEILFLHEKLNEIIGKNLVPSYPIYLLTLLQALEINNKVDLSQTSYGHCYHSLIYMTLRKSGVDDRKVDFYFNFLSSLAFHLYSNRLSSFFESDFEHFFNQYSEEFNTVESSKDVLKKLVSCSIFEYDSLKAIHFKQKYIYYFFIGRFLAENITSNNTIIKNLIDNFHVNENANILMFLIHHSKNSNLLDDFLFNTMLIFEDKEIAKLDAEETKSINNVTSNIFNHVIKNISYQDYRKEELIKKDEHENYKITPNEKKLNTNENENMVEVIKEISLLNKSIKSIEIIGQILKNRNGSIPNSKLIELCEEVYNVSLRSLRFINEILMDEDAQDKFVEFLFSEVIETSHVEKQKLREQVSNFFFNMYYYSSFFIITKVANSVGDENLGKIYKKVNEKIDCPSYELITFMIQSKYLRKLSIDDLVRLKEKYDKNIIALNILKKIVIDHIYMNEVGFKDKQTISELLSIPIIKQLKIEGSKK